MNFQPWISLKFPWNLNRDLRPPEEGYPLVVSTTICELENFMLYSGKTPLVQLGHGFQFAMCLLPEGTTCLKRNVSQFCRHFPETLIHQERSAQRVDGQNHVFSEPFSCHFLPNADFQWWRSPLLMFLNISIFLGEVPLSVKKKTCLGVIWHHPNH